MREYFWHILIILSLFIVVIFGTTVLSLRFSNDITYTDNEHIVSPSITIVDPQLGSPSAPVTVVVYSDYTCVGCANIERMLMEFFQKNPENIRIVWKDMPNTSRHAEALPAAVAARCAGKQGKFWEFHTELFANQANLNAERYQTIASEIGIDTPSFASCLKHADTTALVERTLSEGLALSIAATPTLFINNERFTGNLSQTEIEDALQAAITSQL